MTTRRSLTSDFCASRGATTPALRAGSRCLGSRTLALLAALLPTGCGTMIGAGCGALAPFTGVQLDVVSWKLKDPALTAVGVFDLPFSLVADTLLLPVTVAHTLASP